MRPRLLCGALYLAAVCLWPTAVLADDLQDIDQLFRTGDAEQALRQADAAIAKQPRAAQIRFLKGVMLTDLKREAEARQVFVALTEDFPELPDPYNNLAVLYAASGELQKALNALNQALRNDPTHRAARENLGDVHLALAIQAWSAAQASSSGDDAELRRKLRLAREIAPQPAIPAPAKPAGGGLDSRPNRPLKL
jgi:Flp pilus assembly protein TadD